jgi:hypothetical protein
MDQGKLRAILKDPLLKKLGKPTKNSDGAAYRALQFKGHLYQLYAVRKFQV